MADFKAYFIISSTPDEVYQALTNPLSIKLWSGDECEMSTEVGSEFSLWDKSIIGKNLFFEEGKKIEQQWYFDGEDAESIVSMKLHEHKKGTSIELLHTNIPDELLEEFESGWRTNYMESLKEFFD